MTSNPRAVSQPFELLERPCRALGWVCILFAAADSPLRARQNDMPYELGKDITAEVRLSAVPTRSAPLDAEIHVGLYIPPDLAPSNPVIIAAPIESEGVKTSNRVTIALAEALEKYLPTTISSIFPNTVLRPRPGPGGDELLLSTEFFPEVLQTADHMFGGLEVRIRLTVKDSSGRVVDTVEARHAARAASRMYWSTRSKSEALAAQALGPALDQLMRRLASSPDLAAHLRARAENRSLPAGLEVTATFDDSGGLLRNTRLDAGEQGRVLVDVVNRGPGPAYGVAVETDSDWPQVPPMDSATLGTVSPGDHRRLTLPIAANLDLPDGVLRLRIAVTERRGYGSRPLILEIATLAAKPVNLEIVDVALNDRSGQARGDGDGRPANGETLEALVRVRNAGPGRASAVTVTATSSSKAAVELLQPTVVLQELAANQVAEARLLLRLPVTYQSAELVVAFEAVDARGPRVARASRTERWQVHVKRPTLEVSHRVFDGNSVASSGNRDGTVSNGERIEVAVSAVNHGEIAAHEIQLELSSEDPRLVLQPSAVKVGSLPSQAEGPEERFIVDVPRGFGRDLGATELRLLLTISQKDFKATKTPLVLPFRFQHPEIGLEVVRAEPLVRGAPGTLALQVRNTGNLTAEDLVVEVVTAGRGVDILDERGIPSTKRRFAIGTLAPAGASPQLRVPLLAKQTAAIGFSRMTIAVLQKDFQAVTQMVELRVAEGEIPVIAAQPSAPDPPIDAGRAGATSATISFLQHSTGEHLTAETIMLRFEVQAAAEPTAVRVTQNGRDLPIESARRTMANEGSLQILQYALPVQLDQGENHFQVIVVSRDGIRSDRRLSLTREWRQAKLWVVAVGVGDYSDSTIDKLQFATADARDVFDYFRDTFSLPAGQIFLRTDEQATLREIKSLLGTQLAARADNPDDTVILYFAGHGLAERGAGSLDADQLTKYLLPYDTSLDDPYSTALDMDEVTNILRRLVPDRVVVIIDSCFSGAAGGRSPRKPGGSRPRGVVTAEFLERMGREGRGRVVLTASEANQVAFERVDLRHGVFTYYLLKGLRGDADANRDGEIDVNELYLFTYERVLRETHGSQRPKLIHPDRESIGRILVGKRPSSAATPTRPSP